MVLRRSTASGRAAAAAAVAASAALLRFAGPPALAFLADAVPRAHSAFLSWLQPPYLYLLLNFIILSIAASSRLYSGAQSPEPTAPDMGVSGDAVSFAAVAPKEEEFVTSRAERPPATAAPAAEEEEEFVISRAEWPPAAAPESEEPPPPTSAEKPLVSTRFVNRRSPKPRKEGRSSLRVARQRRGETLESTWRTITEGRAVPLARHLKKSETWEAQRRNGEGGEAAETTAPAMRKAETSRDGGKLRREASLGQDELNRRVEAFIKKFNEEMRLQRQESMRQYMDMIANHPAY